jgi:hypothetical protein
MNDRLYAGAAKVKIQLPQDFFPYRSFRGRYFTALHDDLYVRVVYAEAGEQQLIFVSIELADLGDIPQWQEKIRAVSGVQPEHIFITVPHNHLAPHVSDDWHQEVEDVEKTIAFGQAVEEALIAAVKQAVTGKEPASVAFANGTCDINMNRDYLPRPHSVVDHNPHGISDKTVGVVRFANGQGQPIAFLINYAVHCSVMMNVFMEDGGMHVSGDLCGATSHIVEQAYEKEPVALWTSGAAADQNPKYMVFPDPTGGPGGPPDFEHFHSPGEGGYLIVEMQAKTLADEVLWVSDCMDNDKTQVSLSCAQQIITVPGQKKAPPFVQGDLTYQFEADQPVSMRLGLIKIGDILIVTVPGEIVASIGLAVKEALGGYSQKVMVVTHCNGSLSYMSDAAGYANRYGEAIRSHVGRSWAEYTVVDAAVQMAAGTKE